MAKLMYIETPRGFVKQTKTKNGVITTELKWNPGFAPKLNASHISAQVYLDSEVLRTSNKFAPVVTSMLVKSGILGTKPGDGEVAWIAPYAWYQYHLENRKTSQNVNPNGGPYWFERAWSVYGPAIKRGVENKIKRGL
jgi:hypothetical protein